MYIGKKERERERERERGREGERERGREGERGERGRERCMKYMAHVLHTKLDLIVHWKLLLGIFLSACNHQIQNVLTICTWI